MPVNETNEGVGVTAPGVYVGVLMDTTGDDEATVASECSNVSDRPGCGRLWLASDEATVASECSNVSDRPGCGRLWLASESARCACSDSHIFFSL